MNESKNSALISAFKSEVIEIKEQLIKTGYNSKIVMAVGSPYYGLSSSIADEICKELLVGYFNYEIYDDNGAIAGLTVSKKK